jgi:hypothetical protein
VGLSFFEIGCVTLRSGSSATRCWGAITGLYGINNIPVGASAFMPISLYQSLLITFPSMYGVTSYPTKYGFELYDTYSAFYFPSVIPDLIQWSEDWQGKAWDVVYYAMVHCGVIVIRHSLLL